MTKVQRAAVLVRDVAVLADDKSPTGCRRVTGDLDRLALGVLGFYLPAFTDRNAKQLGSVVPEGVSRDVPPQLTRSRSN
jgi:hypothetical protein